MNKILLTIVFLLLLSISAFSQVPSKPFNIYGNIGVSLPQSPDSLNDLYKMGFHGNIGLGLPIAPTMQIVGKLGYHYFGPDKDGMGDGSLEGGTFTAITYGVDLRIALGVPVSPIKPFGFAGIGMSSLTRGEITSSVIPDDNPFSDEKSESKFYFNVGGGIEFKSGPLMSFFIQASYTGISVDDTFNERVVMIPVSLGIKF